ncbi:trimeric intracellular cation channel family protein [Streptococcus iners]|uniref:Trimeric intracellular cation channel family protein n=1 Tax=Streptococcus iners subsp. hyiners TaxID=3028083 RepID=A0AA97A151_9STRE|nr:trimeric intracellular cation channel family protein [Streptococcus sp. 29892]MCK4029549.1 trimeric intracellular cation channel family protein [Streptococcus suis]WNY49398.1 trimeric intracellular cation channel family protein [Streptococcus sp. 29892]HEM4129653.1 trimeric intracellular cation channel family protein [Streptococcus suis]
MEFDLFLIICNYIGTIAFAVSGAVKGFNKKLDIFGICLLSIITAVGGGIIRDTMANHIPAALTDPKAIYLSICVAIIMYVIVINMKQDQPLDKKMIILLSQTNLVFDAIGLAIFALIGANTGVDLQLNAMTTGILAALTGVGGGIARDLLVNETPIVLKEDVYAVLAFFSGLLYHLCIVDWQLPQIPIFISIFSISLIIRLLVIKYKINLPNMDRKRKV